MNWYTAWCTNMLYNFRHDVGKLLEKTFYADNMVQVSPD